MCMGCMGNADFLVTGGILGAASLRVTARRFLSAPGRRHAHRVTEAEVEAFLDSLTPAHPADADGAEADGAEAALPAGSAPCDLVHRSPSDRPAPGDQSGVRRGHASPSPGALVP